MITLDQHHEQSLREYIAHVLALTNGNVTRAARIAGRHRSNFVKMMKRCGLNRPAKRGQWDRDIPSETQHASS